MDISNSDLLLVGVPIATLTALAVEALKPVGWVEAHKPLAAIILASLFTLLSELIVDYSWLEPAGQIIASGLVLGLASSGGYSLARGIGKR